MRIGVLGPLEARDDAGRLLPVGGPRLRSLLIRLAIGDGRPVSVDRLADDLWGGDVPADAQNAIQALVSRLRSALGRDAVQYGPAGYRLAIDPADIDARAFEQLVEKGRAALAAGDLATGAGLLRQALGLWRGTALADVADAPFASGPITRLSELRLATTEDRVDADLALCRGAELVPELEELATAHPLRERLRGQLMRALQAAGRQADALAAYEDTRRELADQLGVDPSAALAAVHLAILRGDTLPGEPQPDQTQPDQTQPEQAQPVPPGSGPLGQSPPAPARQRPKTNLPAQLTSFVGREEEVRRLGKLLGESRLVTLTGPGGTGKTRLSNEASAPLIDQLSDGVWFVQLASVRDALDVPQAVLTALGMQEASWPPDAAEAARLAALQPLDRLADVLAPRQLILVLDNCEHLVDAVAWLAGHVLAAAPGVRILATSREPLGITGETLFPVPSLQLPAEDASAEEAAHSPAIRLLLDRAVAVRPGFTLDAGTAGPAIRICRALDGIPLAIELAAARLRSLTVAQVADRLDDRFRLLSVGSRGALPRHQTLRAIVDWSWDLLDESERTVLRRLSVFSGGATPDSAEQVCALATDSTLGTATGSAGSRSAATGSAGAGSTATGPGGVDVIDVIASLVDKSLVTATGEREVRYRLLETVRAYAAERLAEAAEGERAGTAHTEFFLRLAELAEPELRGRDQLHWMDRLTAEHDNFAAALRRVIEAGDGASALRFVGALAWFWLTRNYDVEAGQWAFAAREIAGDSPPPGLTDAYAIAEMLSAVRRAGEEFPEAAQLHELLDRVVPLARKSDHPLLVLMVPMAGVLSGDEEGARRDMAALAGSDDPWLRAARLMFGGHLAVNGGRIDEAAQDLAAGYAQFRDIGDRWAMIVCLTGLASVAMARNDPAEAVRLLEEGRGYAAEGVAVNYGEMMSIPLGKARAAAGDAAAGRADLERGVAMAERFGEHDDEASGYVELGELARRDGDPTAARALLERAMRLVDSKPGRADMLGHAASAYSKTGCIAEQEGDLSEAARWQARALGVLGSEQAALLADNTALASVVEGIAALTAARGEHVRAAELLGLAHTLQGYRNVTSLEVRRADAAIRAALSDAQLDAAYARGQALSRADALALTP